MAWASYSPHLPVYGEVEEGSESLLLQPARPENIDMIVVFGIPVLVGIILFFWLFGRFQSRKRAYALTLHSVLMLMIMGWRSSSFWGL